MKVDRDPIADLYIRVSTDEQADKGYSQRNQEEILRKYCNQHSIEVGQVIFEDHSAKTFNRPEWKKLLIHLRKKRNETDLILFTKWDRFSRNAGDAYQMINELRHLNVEPQAIEQPLDLSIPENKMMLAFYLAAPEVENDRRALNVFYGMRRARKEGRYMGLAPVAYKNKVDESGNKYITPKEPDASVIRWAFEQLATGSFNTEQVWKKAREKGIKCSKNAFWQLIRNPLYYGKIFVPKFKDEESCLIQGQHEAIISEELFEKVQDVLDGRGRNYRTKIQTRSEFPLRGFIICPKCGKVLTGSKSKGRNKYYSYYHCYKGCAYRTKSDNIINALALELKRYVPRQEIMDAFCILLEESYNNQTKELQIVKKQLCEKIDDYECRIEHMRDLLASNKIDTSDYIEIKSRYSSGLEQLRTKLQGINHKTPSLKDLLAKDIGSFMKPDKILGESSEENVRDIINMLYPGKIVLGGDGAIRSSMDSAIQNAYDYVIE